NIPRSKNLTGSVDLFF
ncbi:hypothetical protein PRIPAC_87423, partial [Pristionchus pacificus]